MRGKALALAWAIGILPVAVAAQQLPEARIAILLDGPTDRTDPIEATIRREITDLLSGEFDLSFPAGSRIEADWTREGVRRGLDTLLADSTVDLVLALGALASQEAAERPELPRPVIAPYLLVDSLATLSIPNLSTLIVPRSLERDLTVIREVRPPERLAFLMSALYLDGIPAIAPTFRATVSALGIDAELVPVDLPISGTIDRLDGFDFIYYTPLMNIPGAQFAELVEAVNARGLPSMSRVGTDEVEAGVLMTLTAPNDVERTARRIALHAQRILLGDAPESLASAFARGERLTINMETARRIGVYPPWEVLTEAVLLREEEEEGLRTLSLESVAREAVTGNRDLESREHAVTAGLENIRDARSRLFPQIDASTTGLLIDSDRAEASFGTTAERSFSGSATLTQVIYSDAVRTNVAIQEELQLTRTEELDAVRLDVVEQASTAYANLLRAKSLLRVQEENVRATRSHLELANVRVSIGVSGPGEVLRWESQLASARRSVLDARAAVGQAETEVNRAIGRPVGERFLTVEPDLSDPSLITGDPRLIRYTNDPWSFRLFQDFMAEEARAGSPELRRIDAAIAARQREHGAARRAFWTPTIAVQGELTSLLAEGGAGSDFSLPSSPGVPDLGGLFPSTNDVTWNLALRVSLPVFTGGARGAARDRTAAELNELRADRAALDQRIEQRMRVALHAAGSSRPGVDLARQAADAAAGSLELVRDAYAQGVVTVVDLIDAQTAALQAGEAAAAAQYDFLIDLMQVERALGEFTYFRTDAGRDAYFERAEQYFQSHGYPLRAR